MEKRVRADVPTPIQPMGIPARPRERLSPENVVLTLVADAFDDLTPLQQRKLAQSVGGLVGNHIDRDAAIRGYLKTLENMRDDSFRGSDDPLIVVPAAAEARAFSQLLFPGFPSARTTAQKKALISAFDDHLAAKKQVQKAA